MEFSIGACSPVEPLMFALSKIIGKKILEDKTEYCNSFINSALKKYSDAFKYYIAYNWSFTVEYNYIIEYYLFYTRLHDYTYEIRWLDSEKWQAMNYFEYTHIYNVEHRKRRNRELIKAGLKENVDFPDEEHWKLGYLGRYFLDYHGNNSINHIATIEQVYKDEEGNVKDKQQFKFDSPLHPLIESNKDFEGTWEYAGFYTYDELKKLVASVKSKDKYLQYQKEIRNYEKNNDTFQKLGDQVFHANKEYIDTYLSNIPKIYEMTKVLIQIEEQKKLDNNPYSLAKAQNDQLAMLQGDDPYSDGIGDYDGQFYSAFDLDIEKKAKEKEIEKKRKQQKETYERAIKAAKEEIKREWAAVRMGVGIGSIVCSPFALIDATFEIIDMYDDGDLTHLINIGFDLVALVPFAGGAVRAGFKSAKKAKDIFRAGVKADIKAGLVSMEGLEKSGVVITDELRLAEKNLEALNKQGKGLMDGLLNLSNDLDIVREAAKNPTKFYEYYKFRALRDMELLYQKYSREFSEIMNQMSKQRNVFLEAIMQNKKKATLKDILTRGKEFAKEAKNWQELWSDWLIGEFKHGAKIDLAFKIGGHASNAWTLKGLVENSKILVKGIDYEGIMLEDNKN